MSNGNQKKFDIAKPSSSNIKSSNSPVKSPVSDVPGNSSSTDTADDAPYDDLPHDMMTSSYTEISFGESDLEDCVEIEECGDTFESAGDSNKNKQMTGSLSLPQLSSTIVDWSERAKAEYEAEYGDGSQARPSTGKDEQLVGNVEYSNDGMISFVAHDLETKLRLSSVTSSPCISTSSTDEPSSASLATLDPVFLSKLEDQAQSISNNLDHVMKHITHYTTQVTTSTLDSIKNYEQCLFDACDSVDSNIKSMYQLIAKYEELSSVMSPVDKLADEIKEVKRLLTLFEREMETNRYQ